MPKNKKDAITEMEEKGYIFKKYNKMNWKQCILNIYQENLDNKKCICNFVTWIDEECDIFNKYREIFCKQCILNIYDDIFFSRKS